MSKLNKPSKSAAKFAAALAAKQKAKAPPPTPVTKFESNEKLVVTAPTVAAVGLSEWEAIECDQLGFIADYGEVTIPQFRQRFDTGVNARPVLDQLIELGFLVRVYQQGSGRYSLTEAGKQRLLALRQTLNPVTL